jgi:hypothetical protein
VSVQIIEIIYVFGRTLCKVCACVGTAQYRFCTCVLQHGTVIVGVSLKPTKYIERVSAQEDTGSVGLSVQHNTDDVCVSVQHNTSTVRVFVRHNTDTVHVSVQHSINNVGLSVE